MKNYNKYETDKIRIWKLLHTTALKSIGCELIHDDNLNWSSEKDWNFKGKNFSGKVMLKVTQGYLRNREISLKDKENFHKILIPELYRVNANISDDFSGLIECHFRDNDLYGVDATPNN